jgi:hypothetical protein
MTESHADASYVCSGCRVHTTTAGTCGICGSAIVPASEAPIPDQSDLTAPFATGPRPHHGLLYAGLAALSASIVVGIVTTFVSGSIAALLGALSCAVGSFAMLLPWRERHGMAHPERIAPISFPTYPSPSAKLLMLFVFLFPALAALPPGPARVERIVAAVLAWIGFGLLFYRHTVRENEADGFDSRGVPM